MQNQLDTWQETEERIQRVEAHLQELSNLRDQQASSLDQLDELVRQLRGLGLSEASEKVTAAQSKVVRESLGLEALCQKTAEECEKLDDELTALGNQVAQEQKAIGE